MIEDPEEIIWAVGQRQPERWQALIDGYSSDQITTAEWRDGMIGMVRLYASTRAAQKLDEILSDRDKLKS